MLRPLTGSRSTLVAAVSHFSELMTELEVHGSRRSIDFTKDKADALWIQVRTTLDLLVSHCDIPTLKTMVSPNQDYYGVPLPK
jgi:hypothetical protein